MQLDESHVIAPEFWTNLLDAVQDLRDVLDLNDNDAEDEPANVHGNERLQTLSSISWTPAGPRGSETKAFTDQDTACFLFGGNDLGPEPEIWPSRRSQLRDSLLLTFQSRFDAVFKVLHWPTALSLIERVSSSPQASSAIRSLEAAIMFGAASTLQPWELEDRDLVLQQTRRDVERSFEDTGLLTTTSIVVLQAFLIYLVR